MLLRIISMGGLLHYLHHPWNAFDCVMVLAGYTTFIPMGGAGSAGLEGVKALRALRALRPLRTITRCVKPLRQTLRVIESAWVWPQQRLSRTQGQFGCDHTAACEAGSAASVYACCAVCLACLPACLRFAALRSIVVCFLEAVPLLVSVAAMLFFFLFIFAGERGLCAGGGMSLNCQCCDPRRPASMQQP